MSCSLISQSHPGSQVWFRMALYSDLDMTAIKGLVSRFGIQEVTGYSLIDGGNENTSYCLETPGQKYVLTLCDQKSLLQATNLASLLVYLTDHGIRTSRVVVPTEGGVVLLQDNKPVMLKHYVDGNITTNLTDNLLTQLGEEMARLHALSAPSYLPKSFPYGRSYFPEVLNSNLDHAFIDWLSKKNRYLQKRIPTNLPRTLIHGDAFFDNLIVQDDQLVAIIDFEEACCYYRCFDLGMAIVGTCRDQQGICFKKVGRFMRGYQKQITLQLNEKKSLQAFSVYAAVATAFWRFRQYHVLRPDPQFFDKHVEMQILADTISEYPAASFMELFS